METDYKQKYDEVVAFMRDLYPHASDYVKEKLGGYFPELSDMDDECLKRSLIDFINEQSVVNDKPTTCHPYEKWIEWVNKHGGNENTPKWVVDYIRAADNAMIGIGGEHVMSSRAKLRAVLEYVTQHPKYGNETDEEVINRHISELLLSNLVVKRLSECGWHIKLENREKMLRHGNDREWNDKEREVIRDIRVMLEGLKPILETEKVTKCIEWLESVEPKTNEWNNDDLKMLDRIRVDMVDFKNIVENEDGTDVDAINEEIEWLTQTFKKNLKP